MLCFLPPGLHHRSAAPGGHEAQVQCHSGGGRGEVCVGGGVQGVAKVHLRILMSTGLILNMNTTAVGPPLVLL